MNEKKNISEFFSLFRQHLSVTFILSILSATVSGLTIKNLPPPNYGMLITHDSLPYESIIQLFVWSCVISLVITVLTSDIYFKKVMLLWRVAALMILGMAITVAFAVVFHWIPQGAWEAWAFFLIFFGGSFGLGLITMVAKTKIQDKRYNKLLSEYKSKVGGADVE